MSESQHLALDVDSFDLKGAYGEDTWGSPKGIETDEAIRDWEAQRAYMLTPRSIQLHPGRQFRRSCDRLEYVPTPVINP